MLFQYKYVRFDKQVQNRIYSGILTYAHLIFNKTNCFYGNSGLQFF